MNGLWLASRTSEPLTLNGPVTLPHAAPAPVLAPLPVPAPPVVPPPLPAVVPTPACAGGAAAAPAAAAASASAEPATKPRQPSPLPARTRRALAMNRPPSGHQDGCLLSPCGHPGDNFCPAIW